MAHGQCDLALECLTAPTPAMAKTYGQAIRCAKDWDNSIFAKNLMAAIQLARFEQIDAFSDALEEAHSKGLYLIETVPKKRYSIWSSGLDREATLHTDPDFWPGDNGMGQILNQLMFDKFGPIPTSHVPHPKVYTPRELPLDSSDSESEISDEDVVEDNDSEQDYSGAGSENEDMSTEDVGGSSQSPEVQEKPSIHDIGGNSQAQGQDQPSGSNESIVRSSDTPVSTKIDADEPSDKTMTSSKEELIMPTMTKSDSAKPASVSSKPPPSIAAKLASKAKGRGRKSRQLSATQIVGKSTSPRSPSCKR